MLYKMTKERPSPADQIAAVVGQQSRPPRVGAAGFHEEGSPVGEEGPKGYETDATDASAEELQEDVLNGNVLMVDQLWMWAIGPRESAWSARFTCS
jgi:hypothetical protein